MVLIASAGSAVCDLDGPPHRIQRPLPGLLHSGGAGLVIPHFLPPAGAGCFAVAHLRKRLPQIQPSPLGGSGHRLKPLPTRLMPSEDGLRAVPNPNLVTMTTCNHDVFNTRMLLTNKLIILHLFGNEDILPKI